MISIFYVALFVLAVILVLHDKDLAKSKKPCGICLPRYLILALLALLFFGAEAFSLFGVHKVWVISAVMVLSASAFLFGVFFLWERKKWMLAMLQMCYMFVITTQFYSWW